MTNERVAAVLYLAVNYLVRLKRRLRYKMPDEERAQMVKMRERMWRLSDICELVLKGGGSAEHIALIEAYAGPVADLVESYLEQAGGRSMQYRIKAYIRKARGEEIKKKGE